MEQSLPLRQVCREFDVPYSTLKDWIQLGIFGREDKLPKRRIKGREQLVFDDIHLDRLRQFIFLRKCLCFQSQFNDDGKTLMELTANIFEQIDDGDLETPLSILEELQASVYEAASTLAEQIRDIRGDSDA